MSKGSVVLGGTLVVFALYVAAAPYITVYQMGSAMDRRDGEALAEHIEFPSVRENLKEQMNARLLGQITGGSDEKVDGATVLGSALAVGLLEKAVDAWVTPAGIAQLMAGVEPESGETGDRGNEDGTRDAPMADASMGYESIDKFVVRYDNQEGDEVKLVLRRRGLGWKMTEIFVPLD
jgi:hypothetical protein